MAKGHAHQLRERSRSERGSALLIVFLFAAVVVIMLYNELPVEAFELQRQKEDVLIMRGNEYARAVRLYYRNVGRYPTSLEELENTNRMRFLRHKFRDPLTGKGDWKLLHTGSGGALIDSRVPQDSPVEAKSTTRSFVDGPPDPNTGLPSPGGPSTAASSSALGEPSYSIRQSEPVTDARTLIIGSIAGVASNATGHSIKSVNNQRDYSRWEFFYDPQTDSLQAFTNLSTGTWGRRQPSQQTQQAAGSPSPQIGIQLQ